MSPLLRGVRALGTDLGERLRSTHAVELTPLPPRNLPAGIRGWRLTFAGTRPSAEYVVLRLRVDGRASAHVNVWATLSNGTRVHCHDVVGAVPGRTLERLVRLPPNTDHLVVETPDGTALGDAGVSEWGTKPLALALGWRWLNRQLRRPRALPGKVAAALRTVVAEGPRAATEGLLNSEMATQGGRFEAPTGKVGSSGRMAIGGSGARHRQLAEQAYAAQCQSDLRRFLLEGQHLQLPVAPEPGVSIVVVLYGRAELTLTCLRSISEHGGADAQVVIVDNASTDETPELLALVDGAVVLRNDTNLGFLRACRQAVEHCSAPEILFLNNDARLLPGSVDCARRSRRATGAGVVGGRILTTDGRLQEAGGIVWPDGSCEGYGRGDDPDRPEYRFRRPVDYVSGAFLLTSRDLWDRLDGFDAAFAPAYYEDVDYCLRAWQAGAAVLYEPAATIVHYEYASSHAAAAATGMRHNRRVLMERHGESLAARPAPGRLARLQGRTRAPGRRRVLVVDDRVPVAMGGSGAPRAACLLRALVDLDCQVTLYPMSPFGGHWADVYRAVPPEIEVILGPGRRGLRRFLADRAGLYDHLIVSRTHNMASVERLRRHHDRLFRGVRLVCDVEALAALREGARDGLRGSPVSPRATEARLDAELKPLRRADHVTCVSEQERRVIVAHGVSTASVLAHGVDLRPTPRPFGDREGLLFVGPLTHDHTPNVDGLRWFLDEVLPRMGDARTGRPPVVVAGQNGSPALVGRHWDGVEFLGAVDDLVELYDSVRVFVAPTRFSAGVPLKLIDAAAHGLPAVGTDLLARQLGWDAGRQLLVSGVSDAATFASCCARLHADESLWWAVRDAALCRVGQDFGYRRFVTALDAVL